MCNFGQSSRARQLVDKAGLGGVDTLRLECPEEAGQQGSAAALSKHCSSGLLTKLPWSHKPELECFEEAVAGRTQLPATHAGQVLSIGAGYL